MSRAWMPIYWGDYLRDTRDLTTLQHGAYLLLIAHYWQHEKLPTDETQLAAIVGMTIQKWRAVQGPVAAKFQDGWRHKRIDGEIQKAERKLLQRAIAGQKGGHRSGIVRAALSGRSLSEAEANTKRTLPPRLNWNEANDEAKTKLSRTNHISKINTSFAETAREAVDKPQEVDRRACAEATRQELETIFEARRAKQATKAME